MRTTHQVTTLPFSGLVDQTRGTSRLAAALASNTAPTLREAVYLTIKYAGDEGCTDAELQARLDMDGNTERPRRIELYKAGRIHPCGHRKQANGRTAVVWKVLA